MRLSVSTLYLPLFFLTAWLMSNRNLTDKLAYRLSFGMRLESSAIWRFWIYDLLFSSLALPIALAASHYATFSLFAGTDQSGVQKNLWVLVYPLCFILLGFFWPKLAVITIAMGDGPTGLSIAALRDRFLGGPFIQTLNDRVGREIEDYIDRLISAIRADPRVFHSCLQRKFGIVWQDPAQPSDSDMEDLRARLSHSALENFTALFDEMSAVEMTPFRDRNKPLMKVARITCAEEQLLYDAGITSVRALYFARRSPPPQLSPERWRVLRNNARRLVAERCRLAAGFLLMGIFVTGAGTAFSRFYQQPVPQVIAAGAQSPHSDRLDQLKNSGAYK